MISISNLGRLGSAGRWIFWALIVCAGLLFIAGGIFIYQYNRQKDAELFLRAPSSVLIGAPFTIEAEFANKSAKQIKDARITLLLPDGAVAQENPGNKRFININAGPLAPKESFKSAIPVTIFKQADMVRKFTGTAVYSMQGLGSGAAIDVQKTIEVGAREPAINLDLAAPQQVLNGDIFNAVINYKNNSDINFDNVKISLILPQNAILQSALPVPAATTAEWTIPQISKGSGGSINLKLKATGTDTTYFEIKTSISKDGYVISDKNASIAIAPSPLSLKLSVDGGPDKIVYPGQELHYTLLYRNNSDVAMRDVVIKARLGGSMFNLATLRSQGFFSSENKTVTWSAASNPDLELVRPGTSGTVDLDVGIGHYPIRRLSDKNFVVTADADISSPTIPYYVTADKTTAIARAETKIGGQTTIQAIGFFKETDGFENRGPLPLKIDTKTTFTVHWVITNYSTDVRGIEIKSTTLSGVKFTGKVKSNAQTLPVWNERTGEISWTIDKISAAKGVLGKPIEAMFQIEATPNITQVSQPMPLLGETYLTATDEFTGAALNSIAPALATNAIKDIVDAQNMGVVVP